MKKITAHTIRNANCTIGTVCTLSGTVNGEYFQKQIPREKAIDISASFLLGNGMVFLEREVKSAWEKQKNEVWYKIPDSLGYEVSNSGIVRCWDSKKGQYKVLVCRTKRQRYNIRDLDGSPRHFNPKKFLKMANFY